MSAKELCVSAKEPYKRDLPHTGTCAGPVGGFLDFVSANEPYSPQKSLVKESHIVGGSLFCLHLCACALSRALPFNAHVLSLSHTHTHAHTHAHTHTHRAHVKCATTSARAHTHTHTRTQTRFFSSLSLSLTHTGHE